MKAVIITDPHIGCRGDSPIFQNAFERFCREDLFPYIDANNIKLMFNLGDTFDKRFQINFNTYDRSLGYFFDQIAVRGIDYHTIIGNHDTYYRDRNFPNSVEQLLAPKYPNFNIYTKPTVTQFSNTSILWVPWINENNEEEFMTAIDNSREDVLFGHFSIQSFMMQRGQVSDHGIDPERLKKFEIVGSGHFHHRSTRENIWYFGSPYQQTWNDFGNVKGFHTMDLDNRTLEFHPNTHDVFRTFDYDEKTAKTVDVGKLEDCYVRVNVLNKTKETEFEAFMKRIESKSPHKIDVIDKRDYGESGEIKIEDVKDTKKIIADSITVLDIDQSVKDELSEFFDSLYREALEVKAT